MTTRSLAVILLLVAVGWALILGPLLASEWSILRHAEGYRRAEFVVTGGNCIGGSSSQTRGSSPRYCFLTGKVLLDDGKTADEELSVGSSLPPDRPVGSRLAVYYNPARPAFSVNYLNQRVLPAEGRDDPATIARRRLRVVGQFVLLSLGMAVLVHVLLRLGPRRFSRPPERLAVDLGALAPGDAAPALGTLLFSQGVALLLAQIPDPAWGGVVLSLLLAVAGAPFLVRRFAAFSKDDGRATRGLQFLGLPFALRDEALPAVARVSLHMRDGGVGVALAGPGLPALERVGTRAASLHLARQLADFFGAPLDDQAQAEATAGAAMRRQPAGAWVSAARRFALSGLLLSLVVAAAIVTVERVPRVRLSAATTILEPFGTLRQLTFPRRWALDRLAGDASPGAQLELLRLLNTVDAERFPEVAADIDATASRLAGLEPTPEQDRRARIRLLNERAASRLGRELDANGGVLGWMSVGERFVQPIDRIAGDDLDAAWVGWVHFAAGELITPEQFLYAVGPALGDRRPIRFAIWRSGRSFDSQPVPIDSRADVLARTVGEALALQLWEKEGVGDDTFPDDFATWWAHWSGQHLLPPPGEASRTPRP